MRPATLAVLALSVWTHSFDVPVVSASELEFLEVAGNWKSEAELQAQALEFTRRGDTHGVDRLIKELRSRDADRPAHRLMRADFHVQVGQHDLAMRLLRDYQSQHPSDAESLLLIGEVLVAKGDFNAAEKSFRQATEFGKHSSLSMPRKTALVLRLRIGYSALAMQRQDWRAVVKLLQPVAQQNPADPTVAGRIAIAHFELGEPKVAYKILTDHWMTDPDHIRRPELAMAVLYQKAKQHDQSSRLVRLAMQRDPRGARTQSTIARWALDRGDLELARACAERSLVSSNSSAAARMLLARIARFQNDNHMAKQLLESVHLESPLNADAVSELAMVCHRIEGYGDQAIAYAELAAKLAGNSTGRDARQARVTLAWLLYDNGDIDRAVELVQDLTGDLDVQRSFFASKILMDSNRSLAKQFLEESLRGAKFPQWSEARRTYAETRW